MIAGPCTSTSKTGEGVSGEGVTSEGVTGEGVNSESDEEYHLGGSDSEGGFSDEEREDGILLCIVLYTLCTTLCVCVCI